MERNTWKGFKMNYIVLCSDNKQIDLSKIETGKKELAIFGPFCSTTNAEEWVDNECGHKYWNIMSVDMSNTMEYDRV
jgi:hypothetical protein